MMTPDEFEEEMRKRSDADWVDTDHMRMDELMCELLRSLGYGKGVEVFEGTQKWYT